MAPEKDIREIEWQERAETRKIEVWADRKRTLFGLPWSFTRYRLTGEKLTIESGVLSRHTEVVRLYRIKDVTLNRSFGERLFGLGTIYCASSDSSAGNFEIERIKCSAAVADALSDLVEVLRREMRVGMREFMGTDHDMDGMDDGFNIFDHNF
ncbi:MAG: PH domain-containing protein [Oscillospiraceae bacterium]|jgi:hypothetical protein|nr:PH domain-containing protein [Oscillospiraceae bacterium]